MLRIKGRTIVEADLSYRLTGLFFEVHRVLGRYRSERQYGDKLEEILKREQVLYFREYAVGKEAGILGNKVDFAVDNRILVDIKAKRFITKEDYFQM